MGVTHFLLVGCLGFAFTAQAQDCSPPPAGANMILKDEFINVASFPDGTEVSFKCNVGYTPKSGSSRVTCTAGSWSRLTLICEKKNCGPLEELPHTLYNYNEGTEFGNKVVITCEEGYVMPGAEQKRELFCGDRGWMGRQPVCEAVSCEPPPAIVDGSYSPVAEHYTYRDVVQYSCQTDLVFNGSSSRTCSEDGTFQPAAPTCVRVECTEPRIENGEILGGSRPPHKHKSSVRLGCKAGFKMDGSPNQLCGINSEWTPGLPTCKVVTCNPPPEIANGTYSPKKPSYKYRDVIQDSCLTQDFILNGPNERTCSLDGTFKPSPGTCSLIECKEPKIENAEQIEGSPPYRLHNTVKFKCKLGYEMIGVPTMTCGKSKEWTPAPTCKILPSTKPSTTTTTTTTTTTITTPKDYGSSLSPGIIVLIVGICVIVVVLLILIIGIIIYIFLRKKRMRKIPVKPVANDEEHELSGERTSPVSEVANEEERKLSGKQSGPVV